MIADKTNPLVALMILALAAYLWIIGDYAWAIVATLATVFQVINWLEWRNAF